jgi:NAD(P)-dependent dehydrogenase (short-subunit alcohol dehydrogenase family)
MEDLFRLDGKVALVGGGAGGIGEALAMGLSRYGAKVVITSRRQKAVEETASKIRQQTGGETFAVASDATNEASVSEMIGKVVEKMGTIDILVNAQGMNIKRDAFEYPIDDWKCLMDANINATMIMCKHVGRVFKEKLDGKIINLSSVREKRGYTGGNVGYCATKGAVGAITRALALEWAPFNIKVNALGPALIITPGTIHIKNNPDLAKKYQAQIPLGRLAMPEDLVGACIFLASKASDFMTGQTLFVDGGVTAG